LRARAVSRRVGRFPRQPPPIPVPRYVYRHPPAIFRITAAEPLVAI